jgi:hypothetical protein
MNPEAAVLLEDLRKLWRSTPRLGPILFQAHEEPPTMSHVLGVHQLLNAFEAGHPAEYDA